MIDLSPKNIAVFFGGPSDEHDVSLVSGKTVCSAFSQADHNVLPIGVDRLGQWRKLGLQTLNRTSFQKPIDLTQEGIKTSPLEVAQWADFAFPICHGPFGEDGKLQSLLKNAGIPFFGTDVLGCELNLDKQKTKDFLNKNSKIPQVPHCTIKDQSVSIAEVLEQLQLPLFVKPAKMGSSVGISKVTKPEDWPIALKEAFQYDDTVVVEQGLDVREVECAAIDGPEGLIITDLSEIIPNHDFYSYEAKYMDPNGAQIVYPASVTDSQKAEIQNWARQAFKVLECRDFARIDFFIDKNSGQTFFNEINTHPGFTPISQFPQLFEQLGYPLPQLANLLLKSVIHRENKK